MPKQIVGNVYWIKNGKQTAKLVDAQEAFSDPDQAKAQVLFAEASGDKKQIRLVRLAYRQFQGMRYRGENKVKPKRATEMIQKRIAKPSRKEPPRAKSSKKALGGKAAAKFLRRKERRK